MAVSKVIYGGDTLIDLTGDTVDASSLLEGKTAHGRNGEEIVGTCAFDSDTSEDNATDEEILEGKTAHVKGNQVTGVMPNNGAVEGYIESVDEPYVVPRGYHDGSGTVGIDDDDLAKLIPENIRDGVEILGVEGTMSGSEDVKAQTKTVTPSSSEQEVLPDTAEGYNYLASVIVEAIPYSETENTAGGITVTIG